jgi:hypothetical protein
LPFIALPINALDITVPKTIRNYSDEWDGGDFKLIGFVSIPKGNFGDAFTPPRSYTIPEMISGTYGFGMQTGFAAGGYFNIPICAMDKPRNLLLRIALDFNWANNTFNFSTANSTLYNNLIESKYTAYDFCRGGIGPDICFKPIPKLSIEAAITFNLSYVFNESYGDTAHKYTMAFSNSFGLCISPRIEFNYGYLSILLEFPHYNINPTVTTEYDGNTSTAQAYEIKQSIALMFVGVGLRFPLSP